MKRLLSRNNRILLVDDNPTIHEDFRQVLVRDRATNTSIDEAAAAILGSEMPAVPAPDDAPEFALTSAHQGEEAYELVRQAVAAGTPFAVAFVDMRMPPGWDGLTTITKLWEADPKLQIVICTAFSDRSWAEIRRTLTHSDAWLVVKKPFDEIEVLQLAHALTEKWNLARAAGLRTATLEVMVRARAEELEKLDRIKSEFLGNVSHEMLTPMNAIIGTLDALELDPYAADIREVIGLGHDAAQHLLQLLRKVLAFNEPRAVTSKRMRIDMPEWVAAHERVWRRSTQARGLTLNVHLAPEFPASVDAPNSLLDQVLDLLVENAAKFTREGGITVDFEWHAPAQHPLVVTVTDTGIGLSSDQLEWIQQPFAQVDGSVRRQSSGIGLGLPLARRLLDQVGSTLRFNSRAGKGTAVRFAVPADAVPAAVVTAGS